MARQLTIKIVEYVERVQGTMCSVSHSKKLRNFAHLLIKFVFEWQNIHTSMGGCLASYNVEKKIANQKLSNDFSPGV